MTENSNTGYKSKGKKNQFYTLEHYTSLYKKNFTNTLHLSRSVLQFFFFYPRCFIFAMFSLLSVPVDKLAVRIYSSTEQGEKLMLLMGNDIWFFPRFLCSRNSACRRFGVSWWKTSFRRKINHFLLLVGVLYKFDDRTLERLWLKLMFF